MDVGRAIKPLGEQRHALLVGGLAERGKLDGLSACRGHAILESHFRRFTVKDRCRDRRQPRPDLHAGILDRGTVEIAA